uniref:Exportin-T n=1 Tax=Phallusia mammillata TaxID=59560 RepID=A0A6F9DXD6_9ASCI|nr:exportin-T [Phallusia mammillata]
MEDDVIRGLGPMADQYTHSKAVAYFEQIKSSNQGVEICATCLAQGTYQEDHVNFFLWQVLEHQIKCRHDVLPQNLTDGLRAALLMWLQNYSKQATRELPTYLRNKAAQVFALAFAKEYLTHWTTFISDVMYTALGENPFSESVSEKGRDMYLRILLAIDSEVVDRTIDHTTAVQNHNQLLKDTMRERCVPQMVNSWYGILVNYKQSKCIAPCLQVVGAYITWIDINLIANHRFMELIYGFLSSSYPMATREAACDCLREIAVKGMLPIDKLALIETLWGALMATDVLATEGDENIDLVIKLSKLVAAMASTLIDAWNKLAKASSSNGNYQEVSLLVSAIQSKLATCIKMFGHEDDDVSAQCIDFMRDFIDMQKRTQGIYQEKGVLFNELFYVIVKKLKYDPDYQFDNEGEEEVEFQEYLKSIKIIYDNLALLAPDLAIQNVQALVNETLSQWQTAPFNDVEVAIRVLYMLGESLPSNLSAHFSTEKNKNYPLYEMMTQLVTTGVSNHSHSAVRLQFFETVVRYDRYFPVAATDGNQHQVVANTTQAFLDHRGLRSSCPKVRSRCAYLFSRFVKTVGKQLTPFGEEILTQLESLLVLDPSTGVERALSRDDQLFVYELAGNVIVNSNFDGQKRAALMTSLLRPLVEEFGPLVAKMMELASVEKPIPNSKEPTESEICATTLNYAMSYASRTSKAFSNKQTMSQSGCAHVYTDALKVFLSALDTNVHKQILHTGVRQYLHRMVICMEDEVLPFVPITVRHLISNDQSRSLHDFIPLLNQIVNKFKKLIEPFLQEVFMLVVRAVFELLSIHNGDAVATSSDDDARMIRRTYFQFLFALVSNGVAGVILRQAPSDTEMVLSTLIQGAGEFPDPISQKICFGVLAKLVEAWDESYSGINCWEFVRKSVVPVCFLAPLKSTFDLSDAQTVLALGESAHLLKTVHTKKECNLENYLRQEYLPSLNTSTPVIDEYCQALREMNLKQFRSYLKMFFTRAKT